MRRENLMRGDHERCNYFPIIFQLFPTYGFVAPWSAPNLYIVTAPSALISWAQVYKTGPISCSYTGRQDQFNRFSQSSDRAHPLFLIVMSLVAHPLPEN